MTRCNKQTRAKAAPTDPTRQLRARMRQLRRLREKPVEWGRSVLLVEEA